MFSFYTYKVLIFTIVLIMRILIRVGFFVTEWSYFYWGTKV